MSRRDRRKQRFDPMPLLEIEPDRELLAQRLNVDIRTVQRWANGMTLYEARADRYAIELGSHPAYLWPTQWADV